MHQLAVSPVDVLLVVGLGTAGFLVVALVCAGVLAMLQMILPSSDAGADAVDAAAAASTEPVGVGPAAGVDAEGDA